MAGQTYQIAVDGYDGASGNIVLNWRNAIAEADFDRNGSTDILFQNNSTGQRMLWYLNGTAYGGSAALPTVAREWSIVGSVDFNHDGNADIFFQDYATRKVAVWYMNGTSHISEKLLSSANWSVATTADVNGDGNPTLCWRMWQVGSARFG